MTGKDFLRRFAGIALLFAASLAHVSPVLADPHPQGFTNHRFNPTNPVTKDGVTTFTIRNHECSNVKYGDGRGETDCYNGNVRSVLAASRQERLGEAVEYRFELQVDPSITYPGWINDHSSGFIPGMRDTRLRIASWEGPLIHNYLYMVKLDSIKGVRFLSKGCFSKEELGQWNTFSMKVLWASDKRGWIKVTCNDRIVWLQEGVATNQAPECYITNQCEPGRKKNPKRFLFVPGPVMAGFGYEWKKYGKPSPFTEIQKEGITIRMRSLEVRKGASLYDPEDIEMVKALQAHLAGLGCDPGPVDGVVGNKTREAALACREFESGILPDRLDVATLPEILQAYRTNFPAE